MNTREKKYFSKYKNPLIEIPDLVESQLRSYEEFLNGNLQNAIKEFSPVTDYSEKKFELSFEGFTLQDPEFDEYHARENKETFQGRLSARVLLHNRSLGTSKEESIFISEIPYMTPHGTFIINGIERFFIEIER